MTSGIFILILWLALAGFIAIAGHPVAAAAMVGAYLVLYVAVLVYYHFKVKR
jgi:hypothetical protein